jgi:23S rRNA (guanosine2251-2'-O)-methyltransferase
MAAMHSRRSQPAPFPARPGGQESRGTAGSAFWIYGVHAALAALCNPARRLRRLIMTAEAAHGLAGRLPKTPAVQPEILDRAALDRALPQGAVHQGIAVLAEPLPEPDLDEVLDRLSDAPSAAILVLDQVTDPQNVGAVLRSAAAFGAAAVVTPRHHAPPMTGALAKAASGAAEHVALVRVGNLAQAIDRLKESRFWCVALAGDAGQDLAEIDLTGRVALALGAEGPGLRRLTRERCDLSARLPTQGPIADVNVSNAAAVALYECARQRAGNKTKGARK